MTPQAFVQKYMPYAAQAVQGTNISPLVVLAQAGHESNWGKNAPGNNFFGVKGAGTAGSNYLRTWERNASGQAYKTKAKFAAYASPQDSFAGWVRLMQKPAYAKVWNALTPEEQLKALAASPYATDGFKNYYPKIARSFNLVAAAAGQSPVGEMARAPTLQRGDYTPAVAAWQRQLNALGYNTNGTEGKFGPATQKATKAFQEANWLTNDAKVGPQTRFAANIAQALREGTIAQPAGGAEVADVSPEAMGFGPRLPPAALFPSGGPVPPMPIPTPYAGNGPGRSPTGPMPLGVPSLPHPVSSPYISDAGGQPAPVGPVQSGPLGPVYAGNGPGRSPTGPVPLAANPFNQPQPWGAVADQSPATLATRLTQGAPPDVTGGRNLALMGRAPVNFSNADDAPQYTPAQLRDQKAAQDFGGFASGVGQMFAPFFGGTQPAQAAAPQLKTGASAAYGPLPSMAPISRPAPPTITPQQFQQRFAPMGYTSIPQDVTYREASLSPVAYSGASAAPKTISQASFNDRFEPTPTRYDPLSSAYLPAAAPAAVPGVTFAAPATLPASKLAPSQYAVDPNDRIANATSPTSLGGFYDDQTITGNPAPVVKPPMTPARRVAKVAVPLAASALMGPVGALLARGAMGLINGAPLAQRVGQAISYANAAPRTNPYAASPFTPAGFTTPNYGPVSGGSIYAYRSTSPGVGSYINSAGRTINYNVNADQAVYGPGSGLGGFTP